MLEGEKRVRILGEEIAVRAKIHDISSLSAHADRDQLIAWASNFKPTPTTILTHGEPKSAFSLAKVLEEDLGFEVIVPELLEIIDLEESVSA